MIGEISKKIKVQFAEPQIYSLLLSFMVPGNFGVPPTTILFLHICLGYSLDKALQFAKEEAVRAHPETEERLWVMQIYTSKTIKHVDQWLVEQELKLKTESEIDEQLLSEKNILMKKIINFKDRKLLDQHREMFTEEEIRYMGDFL